MENYFTMKPAGPHDLRSDAREPVLPSFSRRWWWRLAWVGLMFAALVVRAGETETNPPANVKISGFGFLGNREMVRLLKNFQPDGQLPPVINSGFVEDAALVLFARATSEGYLNARLQASFTLPDGSRRQTVWTNALDTQLSPDFTARSARFRIRNGPRFYYRSIEIPDVSGVSPAEARSYFVSGGTLFQFRSDCIFSPAGLQNSMSALREALVRRGYQDAVVTTNEVRRNEKTGAVDVVLNVHEGLPTFVRSVAVTVAGTNDFGPAKAETLHPDKPYSFLWQQDFAQRLKDKQYARGVPDTTVEFSVLGRETNAARIQLDMAARVDTGSRVRVGRVIYSGHRHTRTSVLKSRVTVHPGEWLNRIEAEQSRQRLAGLGVFDSVSLRYQDTNDATRNVIYNLQESKPVSLSLLAGYGSYEQLRGGLELEDRNVFGLAQDVRLRGVQSFKSTSGEFQYTVPDILGENVNAFLKGNGLRRQEVSFLRKEYGGSVGLQKYLTPIQSDVSMHYDYEILNASQLGNIPTDLTGATNARSAALVLDFTRDRRVTPLLPQHGLKLFGRVELASTVLGGEVDYQRILLGGSYHLDLYHGLLLHLGLSQGMTFTYGGSSDQLPFNKRFFPGGENSIRGYQQGQASPLDASGNQLGAETYTLGNVEFEQLLTKSWSVIAFLDALGMARDRNDYPWDEELYSVGGGFCWRTLIGPVRLEYGYNLNPRRYDPGGTLQFSIGFPF